MKLEVRQTASKLAMALSRLPVDELDEQLYTVRPAWTWRLVFDRLPKSQQKQLRELWSQRRQEHNHQERQREHQRKQRLATLGAEGVTREYARALGLKGTMQWDPAPVCPDTGHQFPPHLVCWEKIRFGPFVKRLTKFGVTESSGRVNYSQTYFPERGVPYRCVRPRYEQVTDDVVKVIPDGRWQKVGKGKWDWVDGKSGWCVALDY